MQENIMGDPFWHVYKFDSHVELGDSNLNIVVAMSPFASVNPQSLASISHKT
jgi:hypothetical protein